VSTGKQVLWWVSATVVVFAGLIAGFPPSNLPRLWVWAASLLLIAIFAPIAIWLDRERRRAAAKRHDDD
jgi:ABC-type multidrug transport system permease subunit